MTYNTGNPIGSTDARDRSDNSENLDLAVNSLSQTFVDRLGVTRDTLEGIYQKSAYYRAGTFDTGYTLTNNRQTLAYGNVEYSWSGAFPKVVSAGSTPATSGGIGAGAWVDRTDLTLRGELAGDRGSELSLSQVATSHSIDLNNGRIWVGGVVTTSLEDWFLYNNEIWMPLSIGNITGDTPDYSLFRRLGSHEQDLHYELFGAVSGDDCTLAITRCHTYAAQRNWSVQPRSGSWKISGNIQISKECDLIGYGKRCIIESVNPEITHYLQIKGGGHTEWKHTITGMQFITVGIDYGSEVTDFSNGCVIDNCWIREPDTAVNYGHNSWCTVITNTVIQNSIHGVFFDFQKAAVNAGAHMVISNSQILGCSYGVYVNGTTADGFNIMITNCDIEHSIYSIFTNNAGDGTIFWNGGHCELNTGGIAYMKGGSLWISNVWALSYGSDTYDVLFNLLSGQSIPHVYVSDMRLQYVSGKFVKLLDGSELHINKDTILYGGGMLTNSAAEMASTDSVGGSIFITDGDVIVSKEKNITVGPFSPKDTLIKVQKFLNVTVNIDFIFTVTAGATTNKMRVYLNPTGSTYIDVPMDNVPGVGKVNIKYSVYDAMSVSVSYNNKHYDYVVLDPHFANTDKIIGLYSIGGESGSTYTIRALTVSMQ